MERGSTKHGQVHDDEMARETKGMTRGAAQRPHAEEWREPEPLEDSVPSPNRWPPEPEVRDRAEFARVMTRDVFPATRETLLRRLTDSDAPQDLAHRVAALTPGRQFGSVHDVLAALGIASPETRERDSGATEGGG